MEPLFSVSTIFDEKNYIRFSSSVSASFQKKSILWINIWFIIIILIWFWVESKSFFENGDWPIMTIIFLAILLYFDFTFFSKSRYLKPSRRLYNSYRLMQEVPIKYDFYESEVIISNKYGNATIQYDLFYDVIETKHQFIFLESLAGGHFIDKSDCSDDLLNYLRELKDKYSLNSKKSH